MKKYTILLLVAIFSSFLSRAQIGLTFDDTLICRGTTITMAATFTGQVNGLNTDDYFTDEVIDIGFPFVFYGQTYNKCVISGNNFISFDTTLATLYSSYQYNTALNSTNGQLNKVAMLGFQDLDLSQGGTLKYQTFGTPGSRRFIVEYCQVPKYGFSCNQYKVTNQIILYEGSNIIEFHTTSMPGTPTCPSTNSAANGGNSIQGLRDVTGSVTNEIFTPNRAPADLWGTIGSTNSSRRYTPIATAPYYVIDSIPYNPWQIIENANSALLKWYDANGTYLGQGPTMTVTPTNPPPPATGTYYLVEYVGQAGCDLTQTYTFIDTIHIRYDDKKAYISQAICAGETYNFYGKVLYQSGVYDTTFSTTGLNCDSTIILTLTVNPRPNVSLNENSSVKICQGDTYIFRAVKQSGVTYQWMKDGGTIAGATSDTLSATTPGNYRVRITTNKGCVDTSKSVELKVKPNPTVKISYISRNDFCAEDTVTLKATATGENLEYVWTPDEYVRRTTLGVYSIAEAAVPQTGYVKVTVYNGDICSASDSVLIKVHPCCEIGMPSAFTPNGDGKNDYFYPVLQVGQKVVTLQVYHRNGQLIYDNENPTKGWDGKDKNGNYYTNDVFMYILKYNCSDNKIYEKKGDITILR